jgi:hypothetical protein
MTDEVRFALQLGLNLVAVLLAGWLAGRYAARQVRKALEAERQRNEAARRQAQAEIMAGLPPIPPELEQIVEIEHWLLSAHDLHLLLISLGTLIRIRLRADENTQRSVLAEIDRSLKFLGRQENKWLSASLPVVAYVRQLDPAKGKAQDQSLETWTSRINQAYVQAVQSLRRAASLCDVDSSQASSDTLANTYLGEADQATANMASVVACALDRVVYLKRQLPEYQGQQIAEAIAEHLQSDRDVLEEEIESDASTPTDLAVTMQTPANRTAR